jgi:sialate O-acetylesterase
MCVLAVGAAASEASAAWLTDVTAPERAGYSLVYTKDLATSSSNGSAVVYATDNSGSIANGTFDRVGYYMELQSATFGHQFAWVAFDTLTAQANKTGVPNDVSGEFYQAYLSNMNVESNVAGVVTGTGIATGNIEFWSTNYSPPSSAGVPGADGTKYDFGDRPDPGGYGSMQLHNYGASQTLMAYNQWGGNGIDAGIGNDPNTGRANYSPDWTFASNGGIYSAKLLEVYVHSVPEPTSLVLFGLGALGLLAYRRRRASTN